MSVNDPESCNKCGFCIVRSHTTCEKCVCASVDRDDGLSILQEAQRVVFGARQGVYGHPGANMARTAALWNGWMGAKGAEFRFAPEDVCDFMILVKMSRIMETGDHRDSHVDIAGWAEARARTVGIDQ